MEDFESKVNWYFFRHRDTEVEKIIPEDFTEKIIVELKTVNKTDRVFNAQLLSYLRLTNKN